MVLFHPAAILDLYCQNFLTFSFLFPLSLASAVGHWFNFHILPCNFQSSILICQFKEYSILHIGLIIYVHCTYKLQYCWRVQIHNWHCQSFSSVTGLQMPISTSTVVNFAIDTVCNSLCAGRVGLEKKIPFKHIQSEKLITKVICCRMRHFL